MRIALSGYGRMGHAVEAVARERGHEIVARFDRENPIAASKLEGCDAVIDFSQPEALDAVVDACCDSGTALVIGTTGWNDREDEVRSRCEKAGIAVVHAANFSPGATILFALARRAASLFAKFPDYAAGMEERHHDRKKDAPSGTALRIAREVRDGSDGHFDPPIAATRVGAEFGLHTLFFDSPDDLVEISHRARSRDGFARGAVIAAETLKGKRGFYTFEQLMDLEEAR